MLAQPATKRPHRLSVVAVATCAFALLTGCIAPPRWNRSEPSPTTEWTEAASPRAVAIVVHGMNNTTAAMAAYAELLLDLDCSVVSVRLAGHDSATGRRHGASRARWIANVDQAVTEARARYPKLPVVGVGYSLGAALLTSWVDQGEEIDGLVLVAPGIRIRPAVQILRPLRSLAGTGLCLPSVTPAGYRAFRLTSLDTYDALFEVVDALDELRRPRHTGDTPTLILVDRNDELIDVRAFLAWKRRHGLERWVLRDLRTNPWHHVMLDRESVGSASWAATRWSIAEFLGRVSPRTPG